VPNADLAIGLRQAIKQYAQYEVKLSLLNQPKATKAETRLEAFEKQKQEVQSEKTIYKNEGLQGSIQKTLQSLGKTGIVSPSKSKNCPAKKADSDALKDATDPLLALQSQVTELLHEIAQLEDENAQLKTHARQAQLALDQLQLKTREQIKKIEFKAKALELEAKAKANANADEMEPTGKKLEQTTKQQQLIQLTLENDGLKSTITQLEASTMKMDRQARLEQNSKQQELTQLTLENEELKSTVKQLRTPKKSLNDVNRDDPKDDIINRQWKQIENLKRQNGPKMVNSDYASDETKRLHITLLNLNEEVYNLNAEKIKLNSRLLEYQDRERSGTASWDPTEHGWEQRQTSDGNVYWFHREMRKSSFERPQRPINETSTPDEEREALVNEIFECNAIIDSMKHQVTEMSSKMRTMELERTKLTAERHAAEEKLHTKLSILEEEKHALIESQESKIVEAVTYYSQLAATKTAQACAAAQNRHGYEELEAPGTQGNHDSHSVIIENVRYRSKSPTAEPREMSRQYRYNY